MGRSLVACVLFTLLAVAHADSKYMIGDLGESCSQTCYKQGLNCNPHIVTNNSSAIFAELGITCQNNPTPWWAQDQPSFAPDSGQCLGYINTPGGVLCSGSYSTTRRLFRCDAPSNAVTTFGTGLSGGAVTMSEQWIFQHFVADGDYGVMTHYWTTYPSATDNGVVVRYYVDGEEEASIQFTPSMACGVGFYDPQAPWGTKWFGKGSADGGWFLNFRIPFQKSILVTVQHKYADLGGFYMIVRGGTNLPIEIGGVDVPSFARLNLYTVDTQFGPVEWVPVLEVPSGTKGVHFMHTLAVAGDNMNFLEGCYHMYSPPDQEFPGTLLSTGTEDYFDSAWYFNAGEFHLPVSGFTHLNTTVGVQWSAYRFHEMDPLQFNDGIKLVWRNGDTLDPSGIKCFMEVGGSVVGSPSIANVTSYAWAYTWPADV